MAGLLGIGGGGIMVPVLTALFLYQGVPVDKQFTCPWEPQWRIIVTSLSNLRAHHFEGTVIWNIVKIMSIGIISGSFLATFIAVNISSFYLTIFFSLFIAYVSIQMFLNKKPKPSRKLAGKGGLLSAGSGIGAISALVSIGGGSLTVPYLVWQNIDIKKAIGTSAATGLPISAAGTKGYIINGWSATSAGNNTFGFVYLPAALLILQSAFSPHPMEQDWLTDCRSLL